MVSKNEVTTEKTYIEGVRINFLYIDKYSFNLIGKPPVV